MTDLSQAELERLRQQLVDLQSQLAFQEDTIASLDAIVARQQRQIDDLLGLCKAQESRLEGIQASLESSRTDLPPPHY